MSSDGISAVLAYEHTFDTRSLEPSGFGSRLQKSPLNAGFLTLEPTSGLEPLTYSLRNYCSTN